MTQASSNRGNRESLIAARRAAASILGLAVSATAMLSEDLLASVAVVFAAKEWIPEMARIPFESAAAIAMAFPLVAARIAIDSEEVWRAHDVAPCKRLAAG